MKPASTATESKVSTAINPDEDRADLDQPSASPQFITDQAPQANAYMTFHRGTYTAQITKPNTFNAGEKVCVDLLDQTNGDWNVAYDSEYLSQEASSRFVGSGGGAITPNVKSWRFYGLKAGETEVVIRFTPKQANASVKKYTYKMVIK